MVLRSRKLINIEKVRKSFANVTALDGISLEIADNEFFGLLGPNGAGKTTLINILTTYLPADSGKIIMDGMNLENSSAEIKRKIGLVPQEISLYEEFTPLENLQFWGKIYGMKNRIIKERSNSLLHQIGLYDRRNDITASFSGGMKRRLNIAVGIIHDPKIILFDEPTVGVDPQSRIYIHEIIQDFHKNGKTIIYTSHYMEEIEKLATRIGIIDKGNIIALGNLSELLEMIEGKKSMQIKCKNKIDVEKMQRSFPQAKIDKFSISIFIDDLQTDFNQKLSLIKEQNNEIIDINIKNPNLENVFIKLTGRELRE